MERPRETYAQALADRRAALTAAIGRHVRWGNLRVVVFGAMLAVAAAAFGFELISGWWLLLFAVVFFWTGGPLERAVNDRARLGRAVAFYERALARLDGQWSGAGETGVRFLDDGHLYARDLDLFGPSSLFQFLNAARTRIGEETLAAWLTAAAEPLAVRERQDAVAELAPRTDLREDLAVVAEDARTGIRADALAEWGERRSPLRSSHVPFWVWPLTVAGVAAGAGALVLIATLGDLIQLSTDTQTALRLFVLVVYAVCGLVLWRFSGRINAVLRAVSDAAADLKLLAGVLRRLEAEHFSGTRLAALRAALDTDGQPPSRRIAALDGLVSLVDSRHNVFVRLLGPLVLWDVHLVYAIERWRRSSGPVVRRWLDAVGEIEALSSFAAYRFEHPDDVFPDIVDGPPCFDGDGLGHPLLAPATVVPNDVRLSGERRVLVVSGSNMSGKSTLLRTVGVNAVLAQAGAPVRARRLRLTPLTIGASIRIQDSLHEGVSRFYAEITRLGLIMRRASGPVPVLFLIDELLHGTNSHDRRIGAEAIVRALVDRGAIGLVTTHDLALAHVADALGPRGANVHFADEIVDGQVRFDYRMRPGVVEKSNALELMRSVGLDV